MTKIMILTAGVLFAANATNAQIGFAPEIGLNLANVHTKYKDIVNGGEKKEESDLKLGVKVGANVNIPIGERIVIQPGLFYSIKGSKMDESESTGTITDKESNNVTLHYFDIPVNIQYMFNDPNEGRFFVGIGPYLGIAFSGKNIHHDEQTTGAVTTSFDTTYSYKFGNDAPSNDLRRFDLGGQVNAGYLLKSGIFFRGMYQQGLVNLVPQGNQNALAQALEEKAHTTNITISVGYMLGGAPGGKSKKKNPGGMNQD